MRQGGEKVVKLETYLKSQPRMLLVKQKMQNQLERGKTQTKEKLAKKKTEYILQLKIWRNFKKEEEKNFLDEKGKENHLPHHQMFQAVTPQHTPNQKLQLLSKDSR